MSVAPTSKTNAIAISKTTSKWRRKRPLRSSIAPLAPSVRESVALDLDISQAGRRPTRTAVTNPRPSVTANAIPSTATASIRGTSPGVSFSSVARLHDARTAPARQPAKPSSELSVKSCRMIRHRPAPMAKRTAISFRRETARTKKRPATLAQAVRRTSPTAPQSANRAGRVSRPRK